MAPMDDRIGSVRLVHGFDVALPSQQAGTLYRVDDAHGDEESGGTVESCRMAFSIGRRQSYRY
jgi:hypothetical protein